MSHESREAIIRAEEQLKQLGKELELDRYLRVDEDPYPSKRVFKLLKNLDLEAVSFSNVQSAGNPMHIEKLNRQELFDLVLVNFARLCVDGEWDGLLTAGGGTAAEYVVMALDATLTNERVLTAGAGITLADGGAGSTVTISSGGGNPGLDPALIGAGLWVVGVAAVGSISDINWASLVGYACAWTAVCLMSMIPDMKGDRTTKKITFAVKYGARVTARVSTLMVIVSLTYSVYYKDIVLLIPAIISLPFF
ncbi:MAG TPA: hypothetical protein EYN66_05340, partial [Myxococcales bacterium]|nr:hypothetical protein [Myxococcales bacterium]